MVEPDGVRDVHGQERRLVIRHTERHEAVQTLRHERAQSREEGNGWSPTEPMFIRENGAAIDPDYLSYRFHKLVLASGGGSPHDVDTNCHAASGTLSERRSYSFGLR
ncbi:hypothetical protein ACQEVF_20965 [Nonomuraea polychroma]|uniref:hypothetical protein n=1 Tax=Nonomuraea polychroma TaxID=46176 RepID=UPI003D8E14C1